MATVLQTDYAWPEDGVERTIIEAAGHRLVSGPSTAVTPEAIETLVAEHDPQAIMTCWAQVSARAINAAKDLRIVQRFGVGLDNIDVTAATNRGAWVANVPDYCVEEVSDHAIALMLDWARGIVACDRDVKEGRWNPAATRLWRVSDLTVGIIGYGRIGKRTAQKLRGFGCRILIHSRSIPADPVGEVLPLDDLLRASDVTIIQAPYTPETHHMIDAVRFATMRRGSFLINVSRGALVDTNALLVALETGQLSGAGLDVVEGEPNPPRALVTRPDVIVTPHVAFSSDGSLAELRRRAAEEVVRVLAGERPHNPCNSVEQAS
ncbi:MAG TPA: C-terminal binding protein [Sphingomonas sp.]|nr:C-terminal binding protein [Sphingomonas sp.]